MPGPSKITTSVSIDDPVDLSAGSTFGDINDRRYIDNQIRGLEQQVLSTLLRGVHATWLFLDASSAAGIAGDCVCSSPTSKLADTVTVSTTGALAAANQNFGILMLPAAPGGLALVATGGLIPPSITGLGAAAGFVRVTAHRCEEVSSLTVGDYAVGTVDSSGNLTLGAGVTISGGSSGPPTGSAGGSLAGTYPNPITTRLDGSGGVAKIGGNLAGDVGASKPLTLNASSISFTDANHTATAAEYANPALVLTSSVPLTGTRNLVLPAAEGAPFVVQNDTTGGQQIQVIASSGAGTTIPNGSRQWVYFDGTNYVSLGGAGQVSVKDQNNVALTQRPTLHTDGFAASDDSGNAQTVISPLRRIPRVAVRASITSNVSGSVTWSPPFNPTPLAVTWSGTVIRGTSIIVAGVSPALTIGDRVFLQGQTTAAENGIYQVANIVGSTCSLYKMTTLDTLAVSGTQPNGVPVFVREGTAAGWYLWRSTGITTMAEKPYDFYRMDIDDFYLPADGNDYLPAFMRAQEAFDTSGVLTFHRRKDYNFSGTLWVWKNTIGFEGGGGPCTELWGTRFYFTNTTGIRTVFPNPGYPVALFAFFCISGITLWMNGGNTQSQEYHGFDMKTGFHVDKCYVFAFPGNGMNDVTSADGVTSTVTVTCVFGASFAGAAVGALTAQVVGTGLSLDQPAVIFSNTTVVPAGAATLTLTFNAVGLPAPYVAAAGTLTTIVSAQTGWTSITNPSDAVPGQYLSGSDLSTVRDSRFVSCGHWGHYVDLDDVNASEFESVSATNNGVRHIEGVFAQGTIRLTSGSTSIGAITAGQVTVRDILFGLKYVNITGGTLGANSTLDLTFQAVASGSNYNAPFAVTITIIDSATTITLTGVTVSNFSTSWLTQTGTDKDGGNIFDSAFINNTYVACHTSSPFGYNYYSRGGQVSFVGCYEESPAQSSVVAPSTVLGGVIQNMPGFMPAPGPVGDSSGWRSQNSVGLALGPNGVSLRTTKWTTDSALEFYSTEDTGGYQLSYYATNNGLFLQHAWSLTHQTQATQTALAFTGTNNPRGVGLPIAWTGLLLGNVRFSGLVGTLPPATSTSTTNNQAGVYNVGDIWYNDVAWFQCAAKDGSNNLTWARKSPYKTARGAVVTNVSSLSAFTVAQPDINYVAGDLVLLAGQTDKTQNWVYTVGTVTTGTAPLTRAPDAAAGQYLTRELPLRVVSGSFRGVAYITTAGPFTLGTTAIDLIIIGATNYDTLQDVELPGLPSYDPVTDPARLAPIDTTSATPVTVVTVLLANNYRYEFVVELHCRDNANHTAIQKLTSDWEAINGNPAVQLGTPTVVKYVDGIGSGTLPGITFAGSSTSVVVTFTGLASTHIRSRPLVYWTRVPMVAAV